MANKGLTMITTKQKYDDILKKLHTCQPADKKGLYLLLNYYYKRLGK